jgi:hypothetical protein
MIGELRALLASVTQNDDVRIVRYSSLEECDELWAEVEKPSFSPASASTIILFDGEPSEYRTTTSFRPEYWLSPWDWAIAASIELSRSKAPPMHFRCLILDLLPANWGAAGRSRYKLLKSVMPWIRSYSPATPDDYRAAFQDIRDISTLPISSPASFVTPDWIMLRQAWAAFFEAPRTRHSISNLIAPMLMVEGLRETRGISIALPMDRAVLRFRSLMKSVQEPERQFPLDHLASGTILSEAEFSDARSDPFQRYRKMHVWLIDDQYRMGYHTILAHLLLGHQYQETVTETSVDASGIDNPALRISSTGSPQRLLQDLKAAVKASRDRPQEFGNGDVDIACLDLRLFADSTTTQPSESEVTFLKELIEISKSSHMQACSQQIKDAVRAAQRRAEGGVEELASLSLLPLMINSVDPSLPIIIFSSTQQRKATDVFKSYPSVITTFSKPVIAGYSAGEMARQSAYELELAIREALRLHSVRGIWSEICRFDRAIGSAFLVIREPALQSPTATNTFSLDRKIVSHLVSEYQSLLLNGRFADAIQIPDNLLEHIGGKFSMPRVLRNLDIIFLDSLRDRTGSWESALLRADNDVSSREAARTVLKESIQGLGKNEPRDVQVATRMFAESASESYRNGIINLAGFHGQKRGKTATLTTKYGSLTNVLHTALDRALGIAHSQLDELMHDLRPLTDFQFYAPIGAMRNARSHYKCRPLEHDDELRPVAMWIWMFFLEGLQELIQGQKPILPRRTTRQALCDAATARSAPTGRLIDHLHGSEFCYQVISRFGNLLRLGIVDVAPPLARCARYAEDIF